MHLLWLSNFLSLLICFTSVSMPLNSMAHDGGAADNTLDCSTVPYPFGAPGVALDGFEIVCTSTTTRNRTKSYMPSINSKQLKNPWLKLPTGKYLIQNISLQGQVRILTGPIYQQCSDSETEALTRGTGWLNLTGTPFTLSTNDTTFVAIGCDDVVMIEGFVRDDNGGGRKFRSACVSICSNPSSTTDGLGYCQTPIPGPGGLKSFELNLYKVQNTGINRFTNCSAAFFATREEFSFKTAYFDDREYFVDSQAEHVTVLNWAIGDKSCEKAKNDVNSYACKNNSLCHDSPNGVGYFCNCSQGYEGNPYIQGGCTDVDECQYPEMNPCIVVAQCKNTEGSATCACPSRMIGDGKKDGIGCSNIPFWVSIVGYVILLVIIVLGLLATSCCCSFWAWCLQKRKIVKRRTIFFRQNGGHLLQQRLASHGINSETKIFTEKELKKATENYSENNILGQGGYGTVYKGTLLDQKVVAIKKSKMEDENRIEQFINEIIVLSKINHRNVVKLLGCCLETQVPLLVYEFIPNGTLLHLIHNQNSGYHLSWDSRLRISAEAAGAEAAGAVAYLHSAASFPIIHRDIKSSNILLDENFTAKVSDFGASRSVPFDKTHVTTLTQGTFGYLDPEYFLTSQLTEKSDVYSFGVVLAELLTGDKPISFARPEEFHNLAMYFTVAFDEGRLLQVIDPPVASEAGVEELFAIARLTRQCLNTKGEERPTMKEVALELEALRRMRNQQSQRGNEEIQQLLVVANLSSSEIIECSKQYSLEDHMLSSMDLPR